MASLLSLGVVPGSGDSPMWASDDDSQSLTEIFGHLPNSPAMIKATSLFMFGAGQPAHCPAHLADSANDCPPSSSLSSAGSEDDVSSVLSLESMVAPSSPSSDTSGGSSPTMIKSEPQLTSSFFPAFGSAAPPALAASSVPLPTASAVARTAAASPPGKASTACGGTATGAPAPQRGGRAKSSGSRQRHHACSWCPKTFSTTGHLKQHLRIHTGDRPFKCTWCDKAFAQCGDLKRHERIHTGEKPFKCGTCNKAFAQCGNLKKHERIHIRAAAAAVANNGHPQSSGAASLNSSSCSLSSSSSSTASASSTSSASSARSRSKAAATMVTTAAAKATTAKVATATATVAGSATAAGGAAIGPKVVSNSMLLTMAVDSGAEGCTQDEIDNAESRQERSRRSARECRIRKKEYVVMLEARVAEVETQDRSLRTCLEDTQRRLALLQAAHDALLRRTQAAGLF